ncbi:MAG: hypothetical protein ACYTFZ_05785 [Planctomycetota bacterium]|jgi:hypothetical protein
MRLLAVLVLLSCLLAGASAGCSFSRGLTNIEDLHQRIESVVPHETTGAELVEILGSPPNNVLAAAEGKRIWLYTFGDSKTAGLNLIVFAVSRSNIGIDTALFILDKDSVVEEVVCSTNSQDLEWEFWPFGE